MDILIFDCLVFAGVQSTCFQVEFYVRKFLGCQRHVLACALLSRLRMAL